MASSNIAQSNEVKMSHVNLMADTIVANLPEEGLRSVLRSMLATSPSITPILEARTRDYLSKTSETASLVLFYDEPGRPTSKLRGVQQRIRTMIGCGMCFDSVKLLSDVVMQASRLQKHTLNDDPGKTLSSFDGDIIQALTAVHKLLLTSSGSRSLLTEEALILEELYRSLETCFSQWQSQGQMFPFERSLTAVQGLLGHKNEPSESEEVDKIHIPALPSNIETFALAAKSLPRLFSGLWQLSSPSWGIASTEKIKAQFQEYARSGFTAFDMADHYGDAEVVFGKFRASCTNPEAIFGATKYCIFTPTTITEEVVRKNVTERCERMASDHVNLLQFHWQFYDDHQYIQTLRFLQQDERVHALGLCNFDSQRMGEILEAGIKIHTNQVQFSLIDSRPLFKMSRICQKYDVKLLTYGTLCGGFIAEKWLGQAEPELFLDDITPSQRKYYEMIVNWGGWTLFQELLQVLKAIATRHDVSISNVATRWVLDFPYVGAVIVGTRMGVSGHSQENLKSYGWKLDAKDQANIEQVLAKSKRSHLIELLGDCGGEYR